jgi:hypothetical protein
MHMLGKEHVMVDKMMPDTTLGKQSPYFSTELKKSLLPFLNGTLTAGLFFPKEFERALICSSSEDFCPH